MVRNWTSGSLYEGKPIIYGMPLEELRVWSAKRRKEIRAWSIMGPASQTCKLALKK